MSKRLFPHEKLWVAQELEKIEKRIRELGLELGEAMNQSNETWHDNGPADVIQNEVGALWAKRSWLISQLNKMTTKLPSDTRKIAKGHLVKLKSTNENVDIVLGHINIPNQKVMIVGMEAPLHQVLLNKEVGDSCAVGSTIYEVISIELYSS